LAGIVGFVVRKSNGFRVVLTLENIMQSIAVEVEEDALEPLECRGIRAFNFPSDY